MKKLQEQIKRMKSLMGEERLWGNLVEKEVLTEINWRALVAAAKKQKIPVNGITRATRLRLKNALTNADQQTRLLAFDNLISRVGDQAWKTELRRVLMPIKIKGDWLSEDAVEKLIRDMELKDKFLLINLRDGKTADDLVASLNTLVKPGEKAYDKSVIKDMVYLLHGNDKYIFDKLGITPDVTVKKVNPDVSVKKVKPTDKAPTNQSQKQKTDSFYSDHNIMKNVKKDRWRGEYYMTKNGDIRRNWKDGRWARLTETIFWKWRLKIKPIDWIADKTRKIFNKVSIYKHRRIPGLGDAVVNAFKYSPIIMETWAIKNFWADRLQIWGEDADLWDPSTWEFDLDYTGKMNLTWDEDTGERKWVEEDNTVAGIIGDFLFVTVTNNPISYLGWSVPVRLGKMVYSQEVTKHKKIMAQWIKNKYLCCQAKEPATQNADGVVLKKEITGWSPGCDLHGQTEDGVTFGCAYPDGPPSCEELYDDIFVKKNKDDKTAAEVKFESDMSSDESWQKTAWKSAKKAFEKNYGIENEDWVEETVSGIFGDPSELCPEMGKLIDMEKIQEDVDEVVKQAKAETEEKIAEIEYKTKNATELAACEKISKLRSQGWLQCDDWKSSFVGEWWGEPRKLTFADDYTGFSKCWCSDSSSKFGRSDMAQCIKGANNACNGKGCE